MSKNKNIHNLTLGGNTATMTPVTAPSVPINVPAGNFGQPLTTNGSQSKICCI